jgi:ABC-type Zn uptake system ZnuABC Zn-binding protein ZnuA
LWCGLVLNGTALHADERLPVVASLAAYGAIAEAIGGERVVVHTVAAPRFNPHFIEPRPSDVLKLKRAGLFIHSGLDLEVWREPLVQATARTEIRPGGPRELDLSAFVRIVGVPSGAVTRAGGDIHLHGNPHYWLAPDNGRAIARALGAKLRELDPAGEALFRTNEERFLAALDEKVTTWRELAAPHRGKKLVAYHDEWIYLTDFLGLTIERFLEPKPGIPPSPQHIEATIRTIEATRIPVIIQATFQPTDAAEVIGARTGVQVVRLCQNVGELPEARDYIALLDFNIRAIVASLSRRAG